MGGAFRRGEAGAARGAVIAVVALAAAVAVGVVVSRGPGVTGAHDLALRDVQQHVDDIRAAELTYMAAFEAWVFQPEPYPRAVEALDPNPVSFQWGSAFDDLGWAPEGDVAATFQVVPDGDGFRVIGTIDADGDGEPARFVATRDRAAERETPEGVF